MTFLQRSTFALAIILSLPVFGEPWDRQWPACYGGDWPQILGPNRDGQAEGEAPLKTDWKADAPQVVWTEAIGSGYAGARLPAVSRISQIAREPKSV